MFERVDLLEQRLGVPVRLEVSSVGLSEAALSRGERRQLSELTASRATWLRGRRALKRLLGGVDTARLAFPHPRLSVSHSGVWSVAVLSNSATEGTGVDIQLKQGPSARTARLFLTQTEQAWAGSRSTELLRLWTVKEALFKADPDNAESWFSLYSTDDAAATTGDATRSDTGRRFRYSSIDRGEGFLSVATTVHKEDVP